MGDYFSWLVENDDQQFLFDIEPLVWTPDANEALHFVRQADAHRVANSIDATATEHGFHD